MNKFRNSMGPRRHFPSKPKAFNIGDKVRVLCNPYAPMVTIPRVGDIGTVISPGDAIVGVQFGNNGVIFRCWLVKDGNGNTTIEKVV